MNPLTRSVLLLTIVLPFAGCASLVEKSHQRVAQLGQTEAQITKELGPAPYHYFNGFNLFHDELGNEVQAHFDSGHADALFYFTFDRKITETWLSSALKLNSRGRPWILEASSTSGRKVYHTRDGKLYASLSHGNQLLVMTGKFFRNALHTRFNKLVAIDDLPEGIFAPDHPGARIGMKETTIVKNYGRPVCMLKDGTKAYYDGYQDPIVHYKNGICDSVFYVPIKKKKMSDCWVSRALSENSCGNGWIVAEVSKPDHVYFWTPRADLVADLYKHKDLLIYTQQNCRDWLKTQGDKAPKNPYFKATFMPCAPVFLNQTEASMTKTLGKPKIEGVNRIYHDGDLRVRACFDHGICNKIIYTSEKKQKFSAHWVSSTLGLNSRGSAWIVRESSNAKTTFYNTYDNRFYARLLDGNHLGVMTGQLLNKTIDKINAQKLKALNNSSTTTTNPHQ
jgi:hypothetical protein